MIRENQELLNRLNVLSDGVVIYIMLPVAYFLRFYVMPGGIEVIPFANYLRMGVIITLVQLFTNAAFGLYQTSRKTRIRDELIRQLRASLLDMLLLLSWLFIGHETHYSRWTLALFFALSVCALAVKRVVVRKSLRAIRRSDKNLKNVILIGSGESAKKYLSELRADRELGYRAVGYVARHTAKGFDAPYLGSYEALENVLKRYNPDEVVSAIEMDDYGFTPHIIYACEQAGVKLSIIPFYADYMPSHPQFDDLNGIPLMNIRRIPLDNFANAFMKRAMDIVGALILLLLCSPVYLICTIGVKFSSPGPIMFRQERVGRNKKLFFMYKFRSMRVNDAQDSAWSTQVDSRRTKFGSFIRKYSIDELPQFWNVLKGDMSLVGPRPEIPHFVEQFKDEVPLYMIRHQVRPGITGWAQINGLRGDTPIKERIQHDIFYIENWSIWFDIQILLTTVFGMKFINDEEL
ncbi:MAG: undecaprenyl-phosphate glucose phosphotransferase [Ruminococcaceae bacterium]|nr:undecaprenyl-phosphate glucose phosphotransferase [Oscillospiraceae bacterium]